VALTRSATPRASSLICAIRRVVASSCVEAEALLTARTLICSTLLEIAWAARATCSIDVALDWTVDAFFSAVAATSSTEAAIWLTVVATVVATPWSVLVWSATPAIERAISSAVEAVPSTIVPMSAASLTTAVSAWPRLVVAAATFTICSPIPSASVASRKMPFDISSMVAPTSSMNAALACPWADISLLRAAPSTALARSCSLAAARSSALAPTPLIALGVHQRRPGHGRLLQRRGQRLHRGPHLLSRRRVLGPGRGEPRRAALHGAGQGGDLALGMAGLVELGPDGVDVVERG
jgi:hypothetical protein